MKSKRHELNKHTMELKRESRGKLREIFETAYNSYLYRSQVVDFIRYETGSLGKTEMIASTLGGAIGAGLATYLLTNSFIPAIPATLTGAFAGFIAGAIRYANKDPDYEFYKKDAVRNIQTRGIESKIQ